ncbi:expressed unknown protein [Seminavis robusta]|uniref:Uncharacterized protein n=1 Tax=Seminavis robusta TaxID=568900 RepID=A0A9N8E5U4_9STRA|nr:expressed unknown protein [Seminavis robusta]|eukprot:Sro702_g189990.1 n/a (391) ;mRNA; f:33682-34967
MSSSSAFLWVSFCEYSNTIQLNDYENKNQVHFKVLDRRGGASEKILGRLPGQMRHEEIKHVVIYSGLPGLLVKESKVATKLFQEIASLGSLRSLSMDLLERMPHHAFFLRQLQEATAARPKRSGTRFPNFGTCMDTCLLKACLTASDKLTKDQIPSGVNPTVVKAICSSKHLLSLDLSSKESFLGHNCMQHLIEALTPPPTNNGLLGKRKGHDTGTGVATLAQLKQLRLANLGLSLDSLRELCQRFEQHSCIAELHLENIRVLVSCGDVEGLSDGHFWEMLLRLLRQNASSLLQGVTFSLRYQNYNRIMRTQETHSLHIGPPSNIQQQIYDILHRKNATVGTLNVGVMVHPGIQVLLDLNRFGLGSLWGQKAFPTIEKTFRGQWKRLHSR